MKIVVILLQVLVAIIFFLAGLFKLLQGKKSLKEPEAGEESSQLFPYKSMRIISLVEISCSLILIVSIFFPSLRFATLICTLVLIIIIIGAPITHLKLGEHKEAALTALLLFMLVFITFYQFLT
ncbi:MAG TPA: DoxX family protein [Prolixibacteraceae bacterium]|nr:DoxX family protein [Prolixibacteraceae bacterium]